MPFMHMPSNLQHTLVKLACFLHNGQKEINLQLNKNDRVACQAGHPVTHFRLLF